MRDFIDKKEGKLTILRFVGFCIMIVGALTLMVCSFLQGATIPQLVAIAFFITMLGFALAFPSLLEGNEGLSTMRIVVFMITNVVCMLLLKVGWASATLAEIGLDQYWVGIIAFTFGAKATQRFFESKMAMPPDTQVNRVASAEFSSADVAKLAVIQNEQFLRAKFRNIVAVSDTIGDVSKKQSHVVALYLSDDKTAGLPDSVPVLLPDGTKKAVQVEVVKGAGVAKIQYSQLNSEVTRHDLLNYAGSVYCGVESSIPGNNLKGLVTSAHIFTKGFYSESNNGLLDSVKQTPVFLNGGNAGKWYYKMLTHKQDLAIVLLEQGQTEDLNYKRFNNKFYDVSDRDLNSATQNVTMLSKNNKTVHAYILDYNIASDVNYDSGPVYKKNLILIGSTNNRETCAPISNGGDSGSCVFHTGSNKLIGILLGRNEKFSLVLPIQDTLKFFNLKTI